MRIAERTRRLIRGEQTDGSRDDRSDDKDSWFERWCKKWIWDCEELVSDLKSPKKLTLESRKFTNEDLKIWLRSTDKKVDKSLTKSSVEKIDEKSELKKLTKRYVSKWPKGSWKNWRKSDAGPPGGSFYTPF